MKPLLALFSVAAMIGFAGPAYAGGGASPFGGGGQQQQQQPDVNSPAAQAFLTALRTSGITYTRADQAVASAEAVCHLAGDGRSGPEIVNIIQNNNPGLTKDHAAQFLAMAERSYCPPPAPPEAPGPGGPPDGNPPPPG